MHLWKTNIENRKYVTNRSFSQQHFTNVQVFCINFWTKDTEHEKKSHDIFLCYVKHQSSKGLTCSKFKKLNIKNESRKTKDFYIGSSAEKIARKLRKEKKDDIVREFQSSVKKSLMNTVIYMQQNFPLTNKPLISTQWTRLDVYGTLGNL